MEVRWHPIVTVLVAFGLAVAALGAALGPLELREEPALATLLGTLLLVSAILERSLDVLLTELRARRSEELSGEVRRLEAEIQRRCAEPDGEATVGGLRDELARTKEDRTRYRAETMRVAGRYALWLGVAVAAIGVRALAPLVEPEALAAASDVQRSAFGVLDVVLTGAVLAGGSDAVHKLVEVYRSFTARKSEPRPAGG